MRLEVAGRRLEVADLAGTEAAGPPLVLLHEGLGCVRLWRDWPQRLAAATGRRVIAYSRAGYGASDPVDLPRPLRYMHHEALAVLPPLLERLEVDRPVLVGHSDGASIALIHAGSAGRPVAGLVLLAPHVFVEERTLAGIRAARRAYLDDDLRPRLARYHDDVDNAFWGWNDAWLDPAFAAWNIEDVLARLPSPCLVVQGADDPYGTPAQIEAIRRGSGAGVESHLLAGCGHAPHAERPEETSALVLGWLAGRRLPG